MSRLYGEPVDVWARDGKPARFAWRGRLYTVLGVLERWVVSPEWWKQDSGESGRAEHEFWRIEASPGRSIPPTMYELRHDTATGNWLLSRVWD